MRAVITASLGLLALAIAPAARADHSNANLPWPSLLPSAPVTTAVQPHPVPNCPKATLACVDRLLERLDRDQRAYAATCDHRVIFARSYFRITQLIRDDLAARRPGLFRYRGWFTYLVTLFSNMYYEASGNYARGSGPVPDAWRSAFDAAARGDATAGQDLLLASNAHVQHDLPLALAELGLRTRRGASRKGDHDAINEINSRLYDELEDEFAARYDPMFTLMDLKPLPLNEIGGLEFIKVWREGAWRSAERLMNARTPQARAAEIAAIEANSRTWARLIAGGGPPGWRETRDAHCRQSRPDS